MKDYSKLPRVQLPVVHSSGQRWGGCGPAVYARGHRMSPLLRGDELPFSELKYLTAQSVHAPGSRRYDR